MDVRIIAISDADDAQSQQQGSLPLGRPDVVDEDYEQGLPGYHDPTAGFGGAAPARSALTLRAVLAGFGLVFCTVAAVVVIMEDLMAFGVVLAVLAVVDLAWVVHRKRRGEPG